ncbi:hypothetical protein PIIN_11195 [Serendipita indica DSM 11827]|uniref:ATP adenylyltransferase C-terminal domain-containing protein n=1 Tax=Serendipita indica (strain DSM 11827) TaxID=1109443 RepID=G4U0X0_SERID|nr:hypothetical protein PIIN_11195 [Serendipita indica DSM 11827]
MKCVHAHHSTADGNRTVGNGANLEVASAFEGGGPSTPSYNVVMTLEHIYLFLRTAEKYTPTSSSANLTLSIDSLGFVGMLLVKSEEERALVKGIGITSILRRVDPKGPKAFDDISIRVHCLVGVNMHAHGCRLGEHAFLHVVHVHVKLDVLPTLVVLVACSGSADSIVVEWDNHLGRW